MSGENLQLLKHLTERLSPVPAAPGEMKSGFYRYPTTDGLGSVLAWRLLSQPDVAVANIFLSSGSKYPAHSHDKSREFIIVYMGALKIESNDSLTCLPEGSKEVVLRPEGCLCFERGQVHAAEALEDTWLIAITIPRDEAYPE